MDILFNVMCTVGIWGFIVFGIFLIIYDRRKSKNKINEKNAENQGILELQRLIAEKDEKMFDVFNGFAQSVISQINNGITHTVEDEKKNQEINEYLDDVLQCLLEKTHAHRAFIFSYHNGERSIDGRGYQKMSCTNERTVPWISPIMAGCQNLQRSMLSSVYKQLINNDSYFIRDIEELQDTDSVAYDFIKKHGTKSVFLHQLKREDGLVTGFIGIEYVKDVELDEENIAKYLEKKALKVTGAFLGNGYNKKGDEGNV